MTSRIGKANWAVIFLAATILAACARNGPAPVVYKGSTPQTATTTERAKTSNRAAKRQDTVSRRKLAPIAQKTRQKTKRLSPVIAARTRSHRVAPGETLYAIGKRYEVSLRALIEANALQPPYHLSRGQQLRLPLPQWHQVHGGDTLYKISHDYDVSMRDLVLANKLRPPYALYPGDRLRVPYNDANKPATTVARQPARRTRAVPSNSLGQGRLKKIAGIAVPAEKPDRSIGSGRERVYGRSSNARPPPRSSRRFAWPVVGRLASRFGPKAGGRRNDGINIHARFGAPVFAAENGVVAYAGNELRGFGNLLLLRHAGGWITAYAHNGKIEVRAGQKVRRGQVIARVGRSGSVNRPQLHFEVRNGRRVLDPMRYLMRRKSARLRG